jgi:hypothetical protein
MKGKTAAAVKTALAAVYLQLPGDGVNPSETDAPDIEEPPVPDGQD